MRGSKVQKLILDGQGSYLGMEKGCFTNRDRKGNVKRYPLFEQEIGEVILRSGNTVSTGALASLGFWDIDVLILTQRGKPVAMLRSLDDDSHVKTRLCQYEAYQNGKGVQIAKQFVQSKIEGQNIILEKYGLETLSSASIYEIEKLESESLDNIRMKLSAIEAKYSKAYFNQIFTLLPEKLRPSGRETYLAYDGMNNTFNLAYEVLKWKVHKAIIRAKLEPYLGFLHSIQYGKPSLVCDFMELYRYLIDDFLIQYSQSLKVKDFTVKTEKLSRKKKGKREYLNDLKTSDFMRRLNSYFELKVDIPRIKHGKKQTLETLIDEEALLFAKYLRNEKEAWKPRLVLF